MGTLASVPRLQVSNLALERLFTTKVAMDLAPPPAADLGFGGYDDLFMMGGGGMRMGGMRHRLRGGAAAAGAVDAPAAPVRVNVVVGPIFVEEMTRNAFGRDVMYRFQV